MNSMVILTASLSLFLGGCGMKESYEAQSSKYEMISGIIKAKEETKRAEMRNKTLQRLAAMGYTPEPKCDKKCVTESTATATATASIQRNGSNATALTSKKPCTGKNCKPQSATVLEESELAEQVDANSSAIAEAKEINDGQSEQIEQLQENAQHEESDQSNAEAIAAAAVDSGGIVNITNYSIIGDGNETGRSVSNSGAAGTVYANTGNNQEQRNGADNTEAEWIKLAGQQPEHILDKIGDNFVKPGLSVVKDVAWPFAFMSFGVEAVKSSGSHDSNNPTFVDQSNRSTNFAPPLEPEIQE